MTDEEIARTLRDLSHDSRVVGKSAPRYGRLSDLLRFVANEIEALDPPEPVDVYEACWFTWRNIIGKEPTSYRCVRKIDHGRDDGPHGGGGHTALPEWAGR